MSEQPKPPIDLDDSPLAKNERQTAATNVGQLLTESARRWPDHPAVAEPEAAGWKSLTLAQLDRETDRIASGIAAAGAQPGMRLALLVPAGIDFLKYVFALFKAGIVIVLIDPGMGKANLVKCLSQAQPAGFVGVRRAHLLRALFRHRFRQARLNFVVENQSWPGCIRVDRFPYREAPYTPPIERADEPAAIIFTTGSTGPAKGVLYTHENFICQANEIQTYFDIKPGGADISGFPLFGLFNVSFGKTTVFPKMNFTRPASVDPKEFIRAIEDWDADQAFGSPALLNTVGRYCTKHRIRMPALRRVMSAGAPVSPQVLGQVKRLIAGDGELYTPYGATEALPVACATATQVLNETAEMTSQGKGICVGERFPHIEWQVIRITDEPIPHIGQVERLPTGEIGELMVTGPVVTKEYVTQLEANALHKVHEGERVWHRMGDVGYLDERGRFWMCGRKSHRVETEQGTLFTVPCESVINTHPAIYRSALVGVGAPGRQKAVLVAEPWPEHWPPTKTSRRNLIGELKNLAGDHAITRPIRHVLLKRRLPTDIRHNSKIFRERLVGWAAKRIKRLER